MTHTIAIRDSGGITANDYKLVFSGKDHKPSFADVHGATPSKGAGIFKNNRGQWCVDDHVWGGTDAWTYKGRKVRMAFDDPSRIEIKINDGDWQPASNFNATESFDGSSPGGSSGGGGGDSSDSSSGGSSPKGGTSKDASGSWNPQTGGDRDLDPKHGVVDRPFVTSEDRTVTVGSGGRFGTIQAALNHIPRFVEHKFWIQLEQGVHGNEPGDSLNFPPSIVAAAHGSIKIVGDADNPRDYAIDIRQGNPMFVAGTAQNVSFEGVHIRGSLQNRFGTVELDSCVVSAGQRWGKGDSVALDTYGGHAQLLDTVLESDEAALNLVECASVSLDGGSRIDVGGPVATSGQGGGEVVFSGDTNVSCNGTLTPGNWDQSVVTFKDAHGVTDGIDNGSRAVVLG